MPFTKCNLEPWNLTDQNQHTWAMPDMTSLPRNACGASLVVIYIELKVHSEAWYNLWTCFSAHTWRIVRDLLKATVVLLDLVNLWIWIMAALISWHWDIFWWPPCSTPAMEYQPRAPRMLSAAVIYRKKTQLMEPKLCRRLQPRLWSKPAEMACWDLRSIYGPTFQDEAWKDMEGRNEILWVWVW